MKKVLLISLIAGSLAIGVYKGNEYYKEQEEDARFVASLKRMETWIPYYTKDELTGKKASKLMGLPSYGTNDATLLLGCNLDQRYIMIEFSGNGYYRMQGERHSGNTSYYNTRLTFDGDESRIGLEYSSGSRHYIQNNHEYRFIKQSIKSEKIKFEFDTNIFKTAYFQFKVSDIESAINELECFDMNDFT